MQDWKDDINKQKADYRQNAVKHGLSQDTIDAKMDEYDGMIAKINTQISQLTQDKQKKKIEKASELNSAADNLDSKIAHLTSQMQESGKKVAENTPKTYEQTAAEDYQRVANSANSEKDENENTVDVLA